MGRHTHRPAANDRPPNRPPRTAVTTARSLQRADRLLANAEATRSSIQESYANVGTPNAKELLAAQTADPECRAIRSYLATGHAGPLIGSASLAHGRWIQREASFLRIYEGGLLYRCDPQRPKDPGAKR